MHDTDAIPLSRPDIGESEISAVLNVLRSPDLSLGPKLAEFENAFARYTASRYAIAVNSGTSALHLCMKAAGVGPGDEVITTPFSFVASANCILYENAKPVFADIDRATYNIDVNRVEALITRRTKAILPVHVFGRPCGIDRLRSLAGKYGLALVEDACEALGAEFDGRAAGTFGLAGVFAFYPNKQITTGEGGMIVTSDEGVSALCRSLRNQGRGSGGAWLHHERLGYNYRLSDLACALGIAQLNRLPEILALRALAAERYSTLLGKLLPDLILPIPAAPPARTSWFVYVVRLPDEYSRLDRDSVIERLRSAGIGCAAYFSPIHLQPFYRSRFGYHPGDFPETEYVARRTIALPFFNRITPRQIEEVCARLSDALAMVRASRVHFHAHAS